MESRSTLHDFLPLRFAELTEASARLRERLRRAEEEIDQIKAAAKAIGITLEESINKYTLEKQEAQRILNSSINMTMKEAALKILFEFDKGLTAGEIIEEMKSRFGMNYPRSSLSPQLSRLKHEGLLRQVGTRWVLSKAPPPPIELGSDIFE